MLVSGRVGDYTTQLGEDYFINLGGGFIFLKKNHPEILIKMLHFDVRIFFNWVGSTTN